ncbi:VOC family protein [Amycolatopsis sp. NPDC051903]|uniref:VOC family protein n=1 Tax=Amycolatopsis sp. NPDC051903 TaxID=3363936 RepID=UPI00379396DF
MAIVTALGGVHHLRLTVTDLETSRAFYQDVLGFRVVAESPGSPQDPAVREDPDALYGGVVLGNDTLILGLRPVADPTDRFESERVGLDHVSFRLGSLAELREAAERLDGTDVRHGTLRNLPAFGIAILSIDDPDGIHLELTAALE